MGMGTGPLVQVPWVWVQDVKSWMKNCEYGYGYVTLHPGTCIIGRGATSLCPQ